MTRDILLKKVCPITRIYDCKKYSCNDCQRIMNDWLDKYDKQIRADTINVLSSIVLEELKEIANDEDYYFDKDNLSLVSSVILTNAEKIKGLR